MIDKSYENIIILKFSQILVIIGKIFIIYLIIQVL